MQGDINDAIANNVGLIYAQLRKFNLAEDPEAESLGYEALYNALLTYDQSKQIRLSTYATVCIYNALGSYVRTLNKQRQLEVISYNNIAYTEDDVQHEFVDFLSNSANVEDTCINNETYAYLRKQVNDLLDSLTNDTHKRILEAWRKSEYAASTVEIATAVGVSQPYASQVLNNIKFALRKKMEEYYYD